jgi:hypothetical protein
MPFTPDQEAAREALFAQLDGSSMKRLAVAYGAPRHAPGRRWSRLGKGRSRLPDLSSAAFHRLMI